MKCCALAGISARIAEAAERLVVAADRFHGGVYKEGPVSSNKGEVKNVQGSEKYSIYVLRVCDARIFPPDLTDVYQKAHIDVRSHAITEKITSQGSSISFKF